MSLFALVVFGIVALLAGSVILMWRYDLKGLLLSIIILSGLMCPFIGMYTLERLPPWKAFGWKLAGAFFLASLTCVLLYGIVLPVRCWWDGVHRRGNRE
jgi:hypothetical protein